MRYSALRRQKKGEFFHSSRCRALWEALRTWALASKMCFEAIYAGSLIPDPP